MMRNLIWSLFFFLSPLISFADPPRTKAIPVGDAGGVKWFLVWASENEERATLFAIVVLFVWKEVYAWAKTKLGKTGQTIERIPHMEKDLENVKFNQSEMRNDMKELIRNFNALSKELHSSIRSEVKYAIEVMERKSGQ
jgi:hypothetical protein